MINLKARAEYRRRQEAQKLSAQIKESKPDINFDQLEKPLKATGESMSQNLGIGVLSLGTLQHILTFLSNLSLPGKDDVEKVVTAISSIQFPEFKFPEVINVNQAQITEVVNAVQALKLNSPDKVTLNDLDKVLKALKDVRDEVASHKPIEKVKVEGKVEVSNFPKTDFSPLIKAIEAIKLPKSQANPQQNVDFAPVITLLTELKDAVENQVMPEFPKSINVDNFPITHTAQPVTHISVNALQGFIKTSPATVGTTLTTLPAYGQLFNRRAVVIYNNSSNTIFVGGSDVTTTNGLPIPANTASPVFDAGYNVILYGIASTNGNDIRVTEVSDEASGR